MCRAVKEVKQSGIWVVCDYGGGGCCECIRAVGYVCVMGVNDLSCSGCSGLARCVNRCDSEWHFGCMCLRSCWLHGCGGRCAGNEWVCAYGCCGSVVI